MPFDHSLAERIRRALVRRKGFTEKRMFGGVGFLLNSHMCIGVWKDSLIVRVGPAGYADALREPDVRAFDITGRPMTGWIMVSPAGLADDDQLQDWINRAAKFVRGLGRR